MGVLRKALGAAGWTTLGTSAAYVLWTRNSKIIDVPPSDYLTNNTIYARNNPYNAPVTQDLCYRQVSISKIRPELLEKDGKLVEAFCAGVWSGFGVGYAYQRRFLEKKYRSDPYTAGQLWDRKDLRTSTYEKGIIVTDHFEVVSKTPSSIIMRCGDSPRIQETRESDGLLEISAEVKEDEGVVEFGLKCVFYNGLAMSPDKEGKPPTGPMGPWVQWLHQQYDKVLMETAITNCTT